MFNIVKELKAVERSTYRLPEEEIVEAFRQGIVFSDFNISEEDYNKVISTWGFDGEALNQTFFESIDFVKDTYETDLQMAKLVYYLVFEEKLLGESKFTTIGRPEKTDTLIDKVTTIEVVDDIKPLIKKHIENVKTLAYDTQDYVDLIKKYNLNIDINKISSRDLKTRFMVELQIPFRTVAEIISSIGGKTRENKRIVLGGTFLWPRDVSCHPTQYHQDLIIKSLEIMPEEQIIKESATYRKELMLMKKLDIKRLGTKINRCLKAGKKHHKPKEKTFLEKATSDEVSITEFVRNLETLTSLQIFRLYTGIQSAINGSTTFLVKTGRVAENPDRESATTDLLSMKRVSLIAEIYSRFANENVKVILPDNVEIALPTSYKNFIGALPFFTKVDITKNGSIGMIWHDMCDYDISAITTSGEAVSYWGRIKLGNMWYSGDVRAPGPKGGAEYISYEDPVKDFNVFVNLYSGYGRKHSLAKLFLNNTPEFRAEDTPQFLLPVENFEGQIGAKIGDKFIIGGVTSGYRNSYREAYNADLIMRFIEERSKRVMTLNQLVKFTGWEVVDDKYEPTEDDIVYDFSLDRLSKQTFIDIFGK